MRTGPRREDVKCEEHNYAEETYLVPRPRPVDRCWQAATGPAAASTVRAPTLPPRQGSPANA